MNKNDSILVFVLSFLLMILNFKFFLLKKEIEEYRTQAVQKGFAGWIIDTDGSSKFKWNK